MENLMSKVTVSGRHLLVAAALVLTTACSTTPDHSPASLHDQANAAYSAGDWAGAASAYEQITKQSPDDSDAWLRMGNMRLRLNDLEGAIAAYQQAADRSNTEAKSLYNLATGYMLLARESLLKAQQSMPQNDVGQRLINEKINAFDELIYGPVAGMTTPSSGVFR